MKKTYTAPHTTVCAISTQSFIVASPGYQNAANMDTPDGKGSTIYDYGNKGNADDARSAMNISDVWE